MTMVKTKAAITYMYDDSPSRFISRLKCTNMTAADDNRSPNISFMEQNLFHVNRVVY